MRDRNSALRLDIGALVEMRKHQRNDVVTEHYEAKAELALAAVMAAMSLCVHPAPAQTRVSCAVSASGSPSTVSAGKKSAREPSG